MFFSVSALELLPLAYSSSTHSPNDRRAILELLLPRSAVPLPGARKLLRPYWQSCWSLLASILSLRSYRAVRLFGACACKHKECSQQG